MATKKKEKTKEKKKKETPKYDYFNNIRGPMTPLVEQTTAKAKKYLTLVEWPQSLTDALHAGILTGKAEEEAKVFDKPRAQPLSHPWNRATVAYRPISVPEVVHV